eukprot:m.233848 g.233848  ORF g.233848 m.233848 type:complete len:434 (+) comp18907_c4_seq7:1750-3051(+)
MLVQMPSHQATGTHAWPCSPSDQSPGQQGASAQMMSSPCWVNFLRIIQLCPVPEPSGAHTTHNAAQDDGRHHRTHSHSTPESPATVTIAFSAHNSLLTTMAPSSDAAREVLHAMVTGRNAEAMNKCRAHLERLTATGVCLCTSDNGQGRGVGSRGKGHGGETAAPVPDSIPASLPADDPRVQRRFCQCFELVSLGVQLQVELGQNPIPFVLTRFGGKEAAVPSVLMALCAVGAHPQDPEGAKRLVEAWLAGNPPEHELQHETFESERLLLVDAYIRRILLPENHPCPADARAAVRSCVTSETCLHDTGYYLQLLAERTEPTDESVLLQRSSVPGVAGDTGPEAPAEGRGRATAPAGRARDTSGPRGSKASAPASSPSWMRRVLSVVFGWLQTWGSLGERLCKLAALVITLVLLWLRLRRQGHQRAMALQKAWQ